MKRTTSIIIILLLVLITCSCATEEYARTYNKQRSLMLLKNTDLPMNKKYHKQKHKTYNKRDFNKHLKNFKK